LKDDPRIALTRAESQESAKRLVEMASRAKALAERQGLKYVAARAARLVAAGYFNSGGPAEGGFAALDYAQRTFTEAGDRLQAAEVLLYRAWVLNYSWKLDEAERACQEALAVFTEAGHSKGRRRALEQLALVYRRRGRLGAAGRAADEAMALLAKEGPMTQRERLVSRSHTLRILFDRGDLNRAMREFTDLSAGIDPIPHVAGHYILILREKGELAKAQTLAESMIEGFRKSGDLSRTRWPLEILAGIQHARGDLAHARAAYEAAAAQPSLWVVLEGREALAAILIDQREYAQAERVVLEVERFFEPIVPDQAMSALAVRVRLLLAQDRVTEAQEGGRRLLELAAKSENVPRRARARIAAALALDRAHDDGVNVLELLHSVIKETRSLGYVETSLEARLALGEVEAHAPTSAAGDILDAVERDARRLGFTLIASKAQATRTTMRVGDPAVHR
jgi:tetratricopeptide (TPR) repeat protein